MTLTPLVYDAPKSVRMKVARTVSVQKCTKPFKNGHSEKPAIYGFH